MDVDADKTLTTLRILWAALLGGQVMFMAILTVLVGIGEVTPHPDFPDIVFPIACVFALLAIVASHVVRMQIYKMNWVADAVTPRGYLTGALVHLAILEGASFFAIVIALAVGRLFPYLIPSFVLLAVQVLNFPHGRPMQPSAPRS